MIFKPFFRYAHKRAVRILRSSVDILLQSECDDPDLFATTGIIFPVVLASLREKTKRPIDVLLRPDDLTWHQRAEIIRIIDDEAKRMDGVFSENTADDAAYYSCVCLNWMEILHQTYFRAADQPDVLPEMTMQVRDDMTELVFRALEHGGNMMENLPPEAQVSQTVH